MTTLPRDSSENLIHHSTPLSGYLRCQAIHILWIIVFDHPMNALITATNKTLNLIETDPQIV